MISISGPPTAARSDHLAKTFPCAGQNQFPMLDASHGDHVVRKMFDLPALAFHDDDFQAVICVQVNVRGGQDVSVR